MKKTNKKMGVIALALVACLMVAGISAYFTDADTATNTFTVGKVSIDLQEPAWNPPEDITPNETFDKDPKILNNGVNDAYVFAEVVVPYANVKVAALDGTVADAADTELFTYTVNSGWIEIGEGTKDETAKTVTHVYAYATKGENGAADSMTALAADATTPTVFDNITFVNVVEDQNLEETTLDVVVNGYAIQTENLTDSDTTLPTNVWEIVVNQNPSTEKATEETYTDILPTEANG